MGHALMDKVWKQWGDLPGNAYKIVLVMAATVLDDDPKPIYWGGWERLAIAGLGRRDWPPDDNVSIEAEKVRKSHWEAVRAALVDAKKAGVISVKTRGKPGSRAEFYIHLDRPDTGKTCIPVQEKPADPQENPATQQENPAPKYQYSQQSQGEITTSSKSVTHQSAKRVAETARSNRLQLVRERAEAEMAATS